MQGDQNSRARFLGLILMVIFLLAADVWLGAVLGWGLAAGAALAGLGLSAAFYYNAARRRAQASALANQAAALASQAESSARALAETHRRLETVLALNSALAAAAAGEADERELMNRSLAALTGLVGALGCSFVPVDEWRQPLPAFTFGQLPEPVLNAWSTHLAGRMLRERCGACQILQSPGPGACPLHPAEVGTALTVYCLPLTNAAAEDAANHEAPLQSAVTDPQTGRTVGVLHLYLPAGRGLDAETRAFLDGRLAEIALAYEAARLRAQENATLRQLRRLRAPEGDFTAALSGLLDGLVQALDADYALIRLRPSRDERLSNLTLQRLAAGQPGADAAGADAAAETALVAALAGQPCASPPDQLPVWVSLPLALPPGPAETAPAGGPLGVLLVGVNHPQVFHPRQQAILQTLAAQAALLIENERLMHGLAYQVTIQERTRLAREIHDGLAQTLAFLKLQAAQMQAYLAQGDLTRLSRVLTDNYQALAEAYLDTRQAIDNLRLTPADGLEGWLDRLLAEFETSSGLTVVRSIHPPAQVLAPEVQAQLLRIIQEALTNIRKHARARTVRVSLFEWQGQPVVEVADDGQGFEAGDIPEVARHGLRGMRERAELLGADFQIISQAQQGTTVRLVLPRSLEEEPSP